LPLESRDCILQLDQLSFAEGSPVCGTEEQQDSAVPSLQGLKCFYPTKLVANCKRRSFLTYREPIDIGPIEAMRMTSPSSFPRTVTVSPDEGYLVLRSKVVHDAVRVVIERQFCTRYDFVAFGDSKKASSALQPLETRMPDHD